MALRGQHSAEQVYSAVHCSVAPLPFLVDPGVNFTLYLYDPSTVYGAHTGIANSRMSSAWGCPVTSERSAS
jgi:hypothetical protein